VGIGRLSVVVQFAIKNKSKWTKNVVQFVRFGVDIVFYVQAEKPKSTLEFAKVLQSF